MPTPNANPHETAARAKKVDALVECVWGQLTPEQKVDFSTIATLRRINDRGWKLLAKDAGVRLPSEVSRKLVIQIITRRVRDSRWGFHQGRAVA
jgi:hypothetical protein